MKYVAFVLAIGISIVSGFMTFFGYKFLDLKEDIEKMKQNPPIAKKQEHKFEMFGVEIVDNYAWLRDHRWPVVKSSAIRQYLVDENIYTDKFLRENIKLKEKITAELKGKIKLDDETVPVRNKDYLYFSRTYGDKNYPVYFRKLVGKNFEEQKILDVNEISEHKKFTKVGSINVSPCQNLIAYTADFSGDEHFRVYVKDLRKNKIVEKKIKDVGPGIVWHQKLNGFFYTKLNDKWRSDRVYFHYLGTNQEDDILILKEEDNLNQLSIYSSSSKEYLFVISKGHDSSENFFIKMDDDLIKLNKMINRKEGKFYYVNHSGDYFYISTNDVGPNFRIVRTKTSDYEEKNWESYISHDQDRYIDKFDVTKNYLTATFSQNGLPKIMVRRLSDGLSKFVEFNEQTFTANSYIGNFEDDDIRIDYSSLKQPVTTYEYSFLENKINLIKQTEIPSGFNPDEYHVERVWAENEGVKIPISLFYKKSLFKKDGTNPLYLYGYGSYGIAIEPSFRITATSLADRGFVYAIAHIRGGDDLGYKWYEDAKFLNKKRTFEDFIKSAEYLISEKYTSAGNITISGGSAGGMLVGNVLNSRPELFKVAIALVPFVDVLNTMLDETLPLTPGEFKEWGNPKEEKFFHYIRSYCPYSNIKRQNYPSIFVTAGISDPRVTYWEAAKWVAKLREYKTDNNLLLLKTNMMAGHAGPSGRFEYIKEIAEDYVFIFYVYGISE